MTYYLFLTYTCIYIVVFSLYIDLYFKLQKIYNIIRYLDLAGIKLSGYLQNQFTRPTQFLFLESSVRISYPRISYSILERPSRQIPLGIHSTGRTRRFARSSESTDRQLARLLGEAATCKKREIKRSVSIVEYSLSVFFSRENVTRRV